MLGVELAVGYTHEAKQRRLGAGRAAQGRPCKMAQNNAVAGFASKDELFICRIGNVPSSTQRCKVCGP